MKRVNRFTSLGKCFKSECLKVKSLQKKQDSALLGVLDEMSAGKGKKDPVIRWASGSVKKVDKSKMDFELFKYAVGIGVEILGLRRYTSFFRHDAIDNAYASCAFNLAAGTALFTLSNTGEFVCKDDEHVVLTAAHECLELLMAETYCYIKGNNMLSDRYEILNHAVIRSLEKVVAKSIWAKLEA